MLGKKLRQMGFESSLHDTDVWTKQLSHRNDCIATHVDDLMVVAKNPKACMKELGSFFNLKTEGTPDYFLGNDYR